ncbi:shikimate kinase [Hesseltinella vesiculosa]|uniref:Gluconokinase n=1 Tax=Hesseltinella vesiculosa TaxID=101127 RepID=A0A1X2GYI7_9FUNG|nr:shikimate kinase [Hesseltinella vesiculosa]
MAAPIPVYVLGGVAGCGKTSVAEAMQDKLHCEYIEGDQLHPAENVAKMSAGIPLQDEDRWGWLETIRDTIAEKTKKLQADGVNDKEHTLIVTCSGLRKVYRDILRQVPSSLASVTFVYLKGSPELLSERIGARKNHFMSATMLQSQLDTLEEPNPAQEQCIVVSIEPPPATIAENVLLLAGYA